MLVSYILGGIHFDFDHSRFAQGAQKVRSLFHEKSWASTKITRK